MSFISRISSRNTYTLANLAALKALTTRPTAVITESYSTDGDGGGGIWAWASGSSTTANDGTVVSCTSGEAGRYLRIYSGPVSPRWFGAKGDGATNDTTAINSALATGKTVCFDGGTWNVTNLTVSVSGTRMIGTGNAIIDNIASSTGNMVRVSIDDFHCEGLTFRASSSASLTTLLLIIGDRYVVRNCRFVGQTWSPRTANTTVGPTYNLSIGDGTELYTDGILDGVESTGGATGILLRGGRRVSATNITIYGAWKFGLNASGGYSLVDFQLTNFKAICCGLYGLTNAGLFGDAAFEPIAFSGWQVTNAYVENCGWSNYLTGVDGNVGAGKYGIDFTDNAANTIYIQAMAKNCAAGGMESKGNTFASFYDVSRTTSAQTTSGAVLPFSSTSGVYEGMAVSGTNIPADTFVSSVVANTSVTLSRSISGTVANGASISFTVSPVPSGHRNVRIDFQYVTNMDNSQEAVGIFMSDTSAATSYSANHDVRVTMVTESAPAWRSLLYKKPFDLVTVSGYTWMCLGDTTGQAGETGQTSPSGSYSLVNTATNAQTTSGTTLYFASTTGMQAGMTVFAEGVPDGTTVLTVNATDIVISSAVTATVASGAKVVVAQIQSDGNMYWMCMGSDGAASSQNNRAVKVGCVKNVTLDIDAVDTAKGLLILPTGGTDNTITGLKATVRARGALYGIELNGVSGDVVTDARFVACDIKASYGFYHAAASGSTSDYSILGGRFEGSTYGYYVNHGTNTVRIDGGAYFYSPARAVNVANGANTVKCGTVTFEGSGSSNVATVDFIAGSGTWDWGNSIIQCNTPSNNVAGYAITGGTLTTRGRVLRQDLSTAPSSTTKGNLGEYMVLATQTYAANGYICTDTTGGVYRWEPLANGTASYGTRTTKTGDFTLGALENFIINNKSGSTCTATLPAASDFPNREVRFVNAQAQLLVSASSNVIPIAGGAAGTGLLGATAGLWCVIQSDGTDWRIVQAG